MNIVQTDILLKQYKVHMLVIDIIHSPEILQKIGNGSIISHSILLETLVDTKIINQAFK